MLNYRNGKSTIIFLTVLLILSLLSTTAFAAEKNAVKSTEPYVAQMANGGNVLRAAAVPSNSGQPAQAASEAENSGAPEKQENKAITDGYKSVSLLIFTAMVVIIIERIRKKKKKIDYTSKYQ